MQTPMFSLDQLKTANTQVIRTKSLFYELMYDDSEYVIFTLKEQDSKTTTGKELVSLHKLFVEHTLADPSEYTFSQVVFGSWDVWNKLLSAPQLKPYITKWRNEADVKRKSLAFRTIVDEVTNEGRSAFSASKYLVEEPWKGSSTKDGRKEREKVRESAEEAFERAGIDEDLKRLKDNGLLPN